MTDIAFNLAGVAITIALTIYGGAILWLHTWMRTLEKHEGEDNGDA